MKHPVDVHVGKRVRHRRWLVGMTQQQLAERVGVKFQQIQKYEIGMNRISASRLWDIGVALGVPISFFFEGLAGNDICENTIEKKVQGELIRYHQGLPEVWQIKLFELTRDLWLWSKEK